MSHIPGRWFVSGAAAWLAAGCLVSGAAARAQDAEFEAWLKQDQAEFAQYRDDVTRQYEAFAREEQRAFEEFVKKAGYKWGRDNVWVPETKVWVQYAPTLEERSAVDFENGVARVQILAPPGTAMDRMRRQLGEAVARLLLSGTEDPVEMIKQTVIDVPPARLQYVVRDGDTLEAVAQRFNLAADQVAALNGVTLYTPLTPDQMLTLFVPSRTPPPEKPHAPWLVNQVQTTDGRALSTTNAAVTAEKIVADRAQPPKQLTGEDKQARQVVTVEFPLVPDHLRVRAERFQPLAAQYAARFKLDPALLLAVMHTESSFNPRARSRVPAFGLMQLVPVSAARDAYRFVYGQDKLLDADYLFDPGNNVELGAAFLKLLDSRYLKAIDNSESRRYCAIAAYNTGAGNVSRAFGGARNVNDAAPAINALKPEQVYQRLRTGLPFVETRDYVQRVRERLPLYAANAPATQP